MTVEIIRLGGIDVKRVALAPRIRLELIRNSATEYQSQPIRSARMVWQLLCDETTWWDREHFLVLALDGRHRPLGLDEVSVGTLTASLVHPREVLKALILTNAAPFILVHNHPSGDPSPSREDHEITERLKKAADLLGITLLDHVILGRDRYYSLAEASEL